MEYKTMEEVLKKKCEEADAMIEARLKSTERSFAVVGEKELSIYPSYVIRSLYKKYRIEYFAGSANLAISRRHKNVKTKK